MPAVKKRYSMGLYVLYFGSKKLYPDVAHHSIWMGPRFKELLSEIIIRCHRVNIEHAARRNVGIG